MSLQFFVTAGVSSGMVFPVLEADMVIGRDPVCSIAIPDSRISKEHCRITRAGGVFVLEDLNSRNGTFVNGRSVDRVKLSPNDKIVVGESVIFFGSHAPMNLSRRKAVRVVDDPPEGSNTFELAVDELEEDYGGTIPDGSARDTAGTSTRNLLTVYQVGQAIAATDNVQELLEKMLDEVFSVVCADRAYAVLIEDDEHRTLHPAASRVSETSESLGTLSISRSVVRKVLEEEKGILSADAQSDERFAASDSIEVQRVRALMCVPLKGRRRVLGMIYVDSNRARDVFNIDDLRMLAAIGVQAGIALENITLFEEKRELVVGSLRALVALLELRDPYTSGHAERVSAYTLAIGGALGMDHREQHDLELACLLHDVGKIVIPDAILRKPSELAPEEREIVNAHPAQGASILANIKGTERIVQTVRHHHEWYDGTGYPDGLSGDSIPLTARILAVADSFDAMHSERPYRHALPVEEVLSRLNKGGSIQFDPEIVEVFCRLVERGRIRFPDADESVPLPTELP